MADNEKVIKGIRKCLSHKPCSENGCPYEDECAVEHLNDPLLRDALAMLKEQNSLMLALEQSNAVNGFLNAEVERLNGLLKEQEAVEPIPPTDESDLWKCGNCNHQLFRCIHQKYCEMCGQAVKWE